MSEIKPVYQVQQLGEWIEVDKSIFDEIYIQNKFPHRILYPAAAYEALQKENDQWKTVLDSNEQIRVAQAKRIAELEQQNQIMRSAMLEQAYANGAQIQGQEENQQFLAGIKKIILQNAPEFSEKVIQGAEDDTDCQAWKFSFNVYIPIKYPTCNDRYILTDEPSMTAEEALNTFFHNLVSYKKERK